MQLAIKSDMGPAKTKGKAKKTMKRVCKKPAAASDDMSDTDNEATVANQPEEETPPVTCVQEDAGAESKVGADDPMQTYQDIFTYEHMQIKL